MRLARESDDPGDFRTHLKMDGYSALVSMFQMCGGFCFFSKSISFLLQTWAKMTFLLPHSLPGSEAQAGPLGPLLCILQENSQGVSREDFPSWRICFAAHSECWYN